MPRLFSIKPALTFKGRKFKGLRGWAGKPLHPPLTDIPVTCYILVAAFDVISYALGEGDRGATDFFRAGTYVIVAGAIGSFGASLTGFWDWWKGVEREPGGVLGKAKHTQSWRTINTHMAVMLTVTALVAIDILVRRSSWDDGYASLGLTILSVVIAGLVTIGAAFGGSLVYDYGFNVETAGDHPVWHESEQDVYPGHKDPPPEA
jgi:uncharacterized membrane protein